MTEVKKVVRPGRNEPCHCGSGKKYKKCHLDEDEAADRSVRQAEMKKAAEAAKAANAETAEGGEGADSTPESSDPAKNRHERSKNHAPSSSQKAFHRTMHQRKSGG